jgi:hypothetical protein
MWSMCRGLVVCLTVLLMSGLAWAKPTLNVQPNKRSLSLSEFLLLDIQIEVKGDGGEPKLKAPSLQDWERVRVEGTGTQQSISIVNGRMSRSFTKNERWVLKPKRSGKLVIGSFRLTGEGSVARSKPIEVLVAEGSASRSKPFAQSGNNASNQAQSQSTGNTQIFLRWRAETSEPFVGQPFVAYLDLYYDPSLRPTHSNGLEQLDLSGFWAKKLQSSEQRERGEVIDGRQYRVQRLVGYRLIPLQPGERVLPDVSMVIELSSVTRKRGSFFNRQQLVPWGEVNAQSETFALNVKTLPKKGRPRVFPKTSVGQTKLSARIAQRRIRADSGVDLTIETRTTGLLDNFPLLDLSELRDFDIYPGQVRTVHSAPQAQRGTRNRLSASQWSKRVQSFLLRPKKVGRLKVPSVELDYFDPVAGRYKKVRTKPKWVTVRGTLPQRPNNDPAQSTKTKPSVAQDFRPLSQSTHDTPPLGGTDSITLFYVSLFGFPFAVGLWMLLERARFFRQRNSGDRSAARSLKNAKSQLADLGRQNQSSLRERAKSAKRVALDYLALRTQSSVLGLAYDDLAIELQRRGASPQSTRKFVELMETFDYESFSGVVSGTDFEPQLDELLVVLEHLESELYT